MLFLDFDGVLHPDEVYLTRTGPKLRTTGELFMWAPLLVEALARYPEVRIVLSTSWVRNLGFDRARKRLPDALKARVVGATWHSSMAKGWADQDQWDQGSRHDQILRYAARANLSEWLALDDDSVDWKAQHHWNLVQTDPGKGLSDRRVITTLHAKLEQLRNPTD
jgi:hypothetical protein